MKLNCNYFDGLDCTVLHSLCKNYNHCNLMDNVSFESIDVGKEISWELSNLKNIQKRMSLYREVQLDIEHGEYLNQKNIFGEDIIVPSDVYYGLDIDSLIEEKRITVEIIRELRKKQKAMIL